ncbi:hypothetical protein LAJ19_20875 (plasmid) [Deinococcus taeanensis]|uniref:hypothetical protein n=1 Tax=Deinococcus taeanensis TaxID=2737050 RepID=UPI001CDD2461|nr:hypothetical protein [Deinococcus taeanensis]UBV45254.1 hypothetical protein LAJ19_20875 [Deinococcus taeanensis]
MRPEFDPHFNGAWDKLDRFHREAATDAALRQGTGAREPVLRRWMNTWTRRVRQVLHLRPRPGHPS